MTGAMPCSSLKAGMRIEISFLSVWATAANLIKMPLFQAAPHHLEELNGIRDVLHNVNGDGHVEAVAGGVTRLKSALNDRAGPQIFFCLFHHPPGKLNPMDGPAAAASFAKKITGPA